MDNPEIPAWSLENLESGQKDVEIKYAKPDKTPAAQIPSSSKTAKLYWGKFMASRVKLLETGTFSYEHRLFLRDELRHCRHNRPPGSIRSSDLCGRRVVSAYTKSQNRTSTSAQHVDTISKIATLLEWNWQATTTIPRSLFPNSLSEISDDIRGQQSEKTPHQSRSRTEALFVSDQYLAVDFSNFFCGAGTLVCAIDFSGCQTILCLSGIFNLRRLAFSAPSCSQINLDNEVRGVCLSNCKSRRSKMGKPIHYKVNGEELTTTDATLTVEIILTDAGDAASVDTSQLDSYTLENIADGRKYENPTDKVCVEDGDQFLAIYRGRTPVA